MDNDEKIARLEEDLNMAYDSLDERITRLEKNQSGTIAKFGIMATIIIGVVEFMIINHINLQIIKLKKGCSVK